MISEALTDKTYFSVSADLKITNLGGMGRDDEIWLFVLSNGAKLTGIQILFIKIPNCKIRISRSCRERGASISAPLYLRWYRLTRRSDLIHTRYYLSLGDEITSKSPIGVSLKK
jgi:hypothetical protein